MEALWYGVVSAMLAVYVVLDGFDLGAGLLHRFIARTEAERRTVLAAFGPFWDGNEVWLIAAGGTLFFAFPRAYAVGFSGFYLPLMLVLWLLVLRGLSIELRGHHEGALWRLFWDTTLSAASGLLAVVLGAALGNILRGVPLGPEGYFSLGLFSFHGMGVLDGYTVGVGLFSLALLAMHGALFLVWKTEGELQARARHAAAVAGAAALLLLPLVTWQSLRVQPGLFAPLGERPLAIAATAVALAGMGVVGLALFARRELLGFLGSGATIAGLLAATAALRYPVMLPSTIDPAHSVLAQNAAAAHGGLVFGLRWWPLGLLLTVGYFSYLFRSFRGKVVADDGH